LFKNAVYDTASNPALRAKNQHHYKTNLNIGIDTCYFITKYMNVSGGIIYNMMINPLYKVTGETDSNSEQPNEHIGDNTFLHNFSLYFCIKIHL